MRFSIIAVLSLLTCSLAAPAVSRRHVVHEKRSRIPQQWSKRSKIHGESILPMRIALKQNNLHKGDDFLMDIADPDSPNYGRHWTAKQVAETFAPSAEAVNSVLQWLEDSGIARERITESQGLNWLHVDVKVSEAEDLLKTTYHEYKHPSSDEIHVACDEYSLPADIQKHVDLVMPTLHFDAKIQQPKKRRSLKPRDLEIVKRASSAIGHNIAPGTGHDIGSPGGSISKPVSGGKVPANIGTIISELKNCDVAIVPDCLRALYEFPPNFPANPKNSYGIVEYTPQAYLPSDLDMFFRNFSPSLVGQRPTFDSIDGGVLQTIEEDFPLNGESDLDLEYAMTLVAPQKVVLYQAGDLFQGASFNNLLDALDSSFCTFDGGNDPTHDGIYPDANCTAGEFGCFKGPENCGGFAATKVISTSYGYNEADLTPFYEQRQCTEYMKLGLQGVTFLYSSGDNGVAGNLGQCIDPATGNFNNGSSGMFNPSFPGGCPYVTSVGATQVNPGATVTQPEGAAESVIFSGGGFSNVFSLPSFQQSAVKTFFAEHKPPYGPDRYNTSEVSRGFPDVSANGVNYVIAIDGEFEFVFGTSCSAPVFGSIITLINAARLDIGKSTLGWMNPAIYKNPGMFNDITSGGNQGCGTPGFQSVKGWDPVTGLGTPNFPKMLAYFLFLP